MKYHNTEELIELLASRYTPAELCEMLGFTSSDLLHSIDFNADIHEHLEEQYNIDTTSDND